MLFRSQILSPVRCILDYCGEQVEEPTREPLLPLHSPATPSTLARPPSWTQQELSSYAPITRNSNIEPPPYDPASASQRKLQIIGHCRACPYIRTQSGECAPGCKYLGITPLHTPWQLKMKNPGSHSTYIQLIPQELPPAYGDIGGEEGEGEGLESRQGLRMIEHVRNCPHVRPRESEDGDERCGDLCLHIGTALLCRHWQLKMQDTEARATYVQLLLVD